RKDPAGVGIGVELHVVRVSRFVTIWSYGLHVYPRSSQFGARGIYVCVCLMYYREGDGLFEVAELNAKHALAEGRVANAVRARKVATSGYTRRWVSRMRRNYAAA
ncbi:unnamed protein product, partial [Ectocarpus fasciculatus]